MAQGQARGMARPLLWSAGAHVLALSACLLVGAGQGAADRLLPAVEVLLVGAEPGPDDAAPSAPAAGGAPRRFPGLPPRAGGEDAPPPPVPAARETRTAGPAPVPPEPPARVPEQGITVERPAPGVASVPAFPVPPGPASAGPFAGAANGPYGGAAADELRSIPAVRPAAEGAGPGGGGGPGDRPAAAGGILLLRDRIQSRIVYPDEAVRRGLEGEVVLRIHIEAGGVPNEIRVARSSGTRLLDAAARRGVVDAAPLPSDPGWVEVPVRFRLR